MDLAQGVMLRSGAGQQPEQNPCQVVLAAEDHSGNTQSFGAVDDSKVEHRATLGDVAYSLPRSRRSVP